MRLLLPATACLLLVTSGCSALADNGGRVDVAAASYPLAFVAERVAGDAADVDNLVQPGVDSHDLELSPRQTATIAAADLVVHQRDFQPAVDAAVDENAEGEVVDAAAVVDLVPFEDGDEAAGADEEHSVDDGHDHGAADPHFWQDPLRMAELGDAVAAALADVDPEHEQGYLDRAADLRHDLEDLDRAYTDGLARCARTTVVVSHDAFGYLERYGLEMEPVAGLSPGAEPTPGDLARLQDVIRAEGVTTVFSERLASTRLTEALAGDLGIENAVLDPVEGLGEDTADEDYLSLMRENLGALQRANGCR